MKEKVKRPVVPDVEELSDLQWARIERGLWQRMDAAAAEGESPRDDVDESPRRAGAAAATSPRTWRRHAAIGGAVAMAAALALWLVVRDDVGGGGAAAHGEAPARVVTRDSATTVSFADAAIEVEPNSALLMSGGAERGATIVLERGRAGFHVAPRASSSTFTVVAGSAMVRVVGTRFEVARDGEAIEVAVREGEVDVRYLGQVHRVAAGDEWRSPEQVSVKPAVETAVLVDAGEEAPGREAAEERAEVAPEGPAPASRRRPRTSSSEVEEARPATPSPSEIAAPAEREEQPAPTAREKAQLAAEFAAAARLESAAPKEAIRRYLALAKRDDSWGSNALFAAARLAHDVGEKERAEALAAAYLRRFPRGTNAPDARALLKSLP